jgi:hypothetical protein
MAKRSISDGGADIREVQAATQAVEAEATDEINATQALLGARVSLTKPIRLGDHDRLPNLGEMVQRRVDAKMTAPPDTTPDVQVQFPPPRPSGQDDGQITTGGLVKPTPPAMVAPGGGLVDPQPRERRAVLRLSNKAKSADVIERRMEVVSCPGNVPAGYTIVEAAGAGLLDLFGVPCESGRVYVLTITEHSSSNPMPRPNPHKPGTVL